MTANGRRRLQVGWALCAAFLLVSYSSSSPAEAAYEPAGSGSTRLELEKGFVALLKRNGVKLGVTGGATLRKRQVVFPVSGGKLDPTSERGTILHAGALTLTRGSRRFRIDDLMVKTTRKRSPLSAKVGGGQIKLFTAGQLNVERSGFGSRIRSQDLQITAKLAVRLNHKLGLNRVFEEGITVGSAATRVQPALAKISHARRLSLELDPALLAKLQQLHVAVNPIHPAEHPGPFTFPIFGGQLAPSLSAGFLQNEGSLELLQLGAGQVFWQEPWLDLEGGGLEASVDLEPAPPYRGKIGRVSIASLDLSAALLESRPSQRTLGISGGRLALSPEGATELNDAFAEGDPVFAAGESLGIVSFSAVAS
jgi:hypothetical protein